jgi:hypothetical protein
MMAGWRQSNRFNWLGVMKDLFAYNIYKLPQQSPCLTDGDTARERKTLPYYFQVKRKRRFFFHCSHARRRRGKPHNDFLFFVFYSGDVIRSSL